MLGRRRPSGNSRDHPSCDFPGFKYLCLSPLSRAWLKHLASGVSIFSPGCPNPITRLRLCRSQLLPKAHRCFTLPAWAGSGIFSKGCVFNRRGVILPLLCRADPEHPRTCTSPLPTALGLPYTTAAKSTASPGKGDGERTTPQNSCITCTAKGKVGASGFVLLSVPSHAWQGWGRWEQIPPCNP